MRRMTMKLLVAVMALGLVAAACSSNDSGSGDGGNTGTTGSTGTTGEHRHHRRRRSHEPGDLDQELRLLDPAQITGSPGRP